MSADTAVPSGKPSGTASGKLAGTPPDTPDARPHGPWVDLHAHPGQCYFGATHVFEAAAAVRAAGLAASSFSTVGDLGVLGFESDRIVQTREFEPGEAELGHDKQLDVLDALAASDKVVVIEHADDILNAHNAGLTGALLTAEGADFVGTDLDRLEKAYRRGVRSITLVHYAQNLAGDIQTSPSRHGGLSSFGVEMVHEMNRLGILIDMAHASFQTTLDAIRASTAPVVISHSHLASPGANHPRLLSADHARVVAETGGLVGAWPSGVVNETLDDFADEICRLIDLVSVRNVAIGTDLDANYKPVLTHHGQYMDVDRLLAVRGLDTAERDAVLGGNVVELMRKVL
ncbi:MAG: membrane dipeptidase [Hyphomicrobiaceae bacterium]|jgi:membrane dipeptidase